MEKPKILSDEDMQQIYENNLRGKPYAYYPEEVYSKVQQCRDIAEAQRDKDWKEMLGQLIKSLNNRDHFLERNLSLLLPDAEYVKVIQREIQALQSQLEKEKIWISTRERE